MHATAHSTKRVALSACAALRVVTIPKQSARFETAWQMADEIVRRAQAHGGVAGYCVVDRYAHGYRFGNTLDPGMRDAREVLLRFDDGLPSAEVAAAAPQAIAIVELADRFVVSATEAPQAGWNAAMAAWVRGLYGAPCSTGQPLCAAAPGDPVIAQLVS
ncbi:MAG TPA: hypothetical protein VFO79_14420 [Xanthomonadales bacterium]|nr:hypothetical protein [Xanthomonadales bacterium]